MLQHFVAGVLSSETPADSEPTTAADTLSHSYGTMATTSQQPPPPTTQEATYHHDQWC